jgi:CPA1 family monovalent cation:H+ antiporter
VLRKKLRGFAAYADVQVEDVKERFTPYQRLHQEVLQAERMTMIQMRNQGTINDEVLHRLEREFDLEEAQLKR